jgi:hypothetical protein
VVSGLENAPNFNRIIISGALTGSFSSSTSVSGEKKRANGTVLKFFLAVDIFKTFVSKQFSIPNPIKPLFNDNRNEERLISGSVEVINGETTLIFEVLVKQTIVNIALLSKSMISLKTI